MNDGLNASNILVKQHLRGDEPQSPVSAIVNTPIIGNAMVKYSQGQVGLRETRTDDTARHDTRDGDPNTLE